MGQDQDQIFKPDEDQWTATSITVTKRKTTSFMVEMPTDEFEQFSERARSYQLTPEQLALAFIRISLAFRTSILLDREILKVKGVT